jgi:hypothetical protein
MMLLGVRYVITGLRLNSRQSLCDIVPIVEQSYHRYGGDDHFCLAKRMVSTI